VKHLSSFPIAHAAVLALVIGVFLVDGCAHKPDRYDTLATPTALSPPDSRTCLADASKQCAPGESFIDK
jgi:hypothetical protein